MADLEIASRKLLRQYREEVRALLVEQQVPTVEILDRAATVLEGTLKQKPRLSVGFIGEAQVGKSSLINALVGRTALPAGGIGPLTAQATRVTYAEDSSFEVRYHGARELRQLAFSMEVHLRRRGLLLAGQPPEQTGDMEVEEEDDDGTAREDSAAGGPDPSVAKVSTKMQYILKQVELLLTGLPDGAVIPGEYPVVVQLEALKALTAERPVVSHLSRQLAERVHAIRALVGKTERRSESTLGGKAVFDAELRLRAAGWMSPLVSELTVALSSDLVRKLDLVDLPGIGVVADPAGKVAEDYITREGDALVLVMRNSGLTSTLAELLEDKGVITKLLFGGKDGVMPIHVLVAVTHLDDVARERYRSLAQEARSKGHAPPDRHALFASLSEEMAVKIRSQLRESLLESDAFNGLDEERRTRRHEVVDRIHETIVVKCVAAPDFNCLADGFEEDAFLKDAEVTNVPALRTALLDLAARASAMRRSGVQEAAGELHAGMSDHLRSLHQAFEEGNGRAVQEWATFRSELEKEATRLRPTMSAYHGEAVAVLKKAIPLMIDGICEGADKAARAKLLRLSRHGQERHYQSLKAALTNDGVWERRDINYPAGITRAFVDHVASDWEPKVVTEIRKTVKGLAERDADLVEQLCTAARRHDERVVVEAQIDAQQRILDQHARSCVSWTKERLEELTQSVNEALFAAVAELIGAACKKALRAGKHQGAGAKRMILSVFEDAGGEAIEASATQAKRVLRAQYQKLVKELDEGFLREHHDPLQAAFEALTNQEFMRAKRSDTQKRKAALARFEAQLSALATLPPAA